MAFAVSRISSEVTARNTRAVSSPAVVRHRAAAALFSTIFNRSFLFCSLAATRSRSAVKLSNKVSFVFI